VAESTLQTRPENDQLAAAGLPGEQDPPPRARKVLGKATALLNSLPSGQRPERRCMGLLPLKRQGRGPVLARSRARGRQDPAPAFSTGTGASTGSAFPEELGAALTASGVSVPKEP